MWLTAVRVGEFHAVWVATAGVCVRRTDDAGEYVCIWEVSMDNIDMAGTNKLRGEIGATPQGVIAQWGDIPHSQRVGEPR